MPLSMRSHKELEKRKDLCILTRAERYVTYIQTTLILEIHILYSPIRSIAKRNSMNIRFDE